MRRFGTPTLPAVLAAGALVISASPAVASPNPRYEPAVGSVADALGITNADVWGVVKFSFCSYFNWWDRNDHPCGEYWPSRLGS